jgi:hypothetical protein
MRCATASPPDPKPSDGLLRKRRENLDPSRSAPCPCPIEAVLPYALLCITREGEHPCPEGAYASSRVFFGAAHDDRECSDCTCGPPLHVVCDGTSALELFDTPDCTGPSTDASLATCEVASESARYIAQDLGECFIVQDSGGLPLDRPRDSAFVNERSWNDDWGSTYTVRTLHICGRNRVIVLVVMG